tara:strand:- start:161 stop:373 length:213 start_codon:yes stop_codon:yes gene_type:complete
LLKGASYCSFLEITKVTEKAKNFPVRFYYTTVLVLSLPLKSENRQASARQANPNPLLSRWQEQGQTKAFA